MQTCVGEGEHKVCSPRLLPPPPPRRCCLLSVVTTRPDPSPSSLLLEETKTALDSLLHTNKCSQVVCLGLFSLRLLFPRARLSVHTGQISLGVFIAVFSSIYESSVHINSGHPSSALRLLCSVTSFLNPSLVDDLFCSRPPRPPTLPGYSGPSCGRRFRSVENTNAAAMKRQLAFFTVSVVAKAEYQSS